MKNSIAVFPLLYVLATVAAAVATEPVTPSDSILRSLGVTRGAGGAPEASGGRTGAKVDLQVQFEHDSAQLTTQAVEQLDELARALKDPSLASNRFRVEGHTDSDGSAEYNQALSARRAQAVKRFLATRGVAPSRLQARGYGESQPIADESTADGKALDRRVAVINLGEMDAAAAVEPPAVEPPAVKPAPEAPKPAPAVAGKPRVTVVVQYERNGEKAEVRPGAVLRPVDNYNVSFTPATRSYVYVLQFDAKGTPALVFPNQDFSASVNPVVAKKSYMVPSDGRWLQLKETAGDEEIVVLASTDPIDDPVAVAQTVRSSGASRGVEPFPVKDAPIALPADLFSYRLPYRTQVP